MALERALSVLPDEFRDAFVLVKADGLKYREAAEALGVPQGTVQSRVSDSARCLRAVLSDDPDAARKCPKQQQGRGNAGGKVNVSRGPQS
jgi:DNA-directed RNA polymerase specialized sigma24 family protein